MRFGVCGDLERQATAAATGFDYGELGVASLLKPRETEAAFREAVKQARSVNLPFPVLNGFVPGELKITGPDADMAALTEFVITACARAEIAGVDVIVFGSGGARRIPDGFDADAAHAQLVAFGSMVAPIAYRHGVTVVVEPLRKAECNVVNSVPEAAALVREVDHPGLRLLADAYHMMEDGDPFGGIVEHGDLLEHVHIATSPNRRAPGLEPCDLAGLFAALRTAGYDGRVSIEGRLESPETELPAALEFMTGLATA